MTTKRTKVLADIVYLTSAGKVTRAACALGLATGLVARGPWVYNRGGGLSSGQDQEESESKGKGKKGYVKGKKGGGILTPRTVASLARSDSDMLIQIQMLSMVIFHSLILTIIRAN